ncbi:MAG: pyridoxamine 5'-phosphate oxidase family protein, partial [Planctomycetota bacterium]
MNRIESIEQLKAIYGTPGESAVVKVTSRLIPEYVAFIHASRFLALATSGPDGLDCSPRGDLDGVVRVIDDKTLHLPDRRGNNRIDSLRNIVQDPRVAMLFLIPGSG